MDEKAVGEIVDAIRSLHIQIPIEIHHPLLEVISWISQIILAVFAIIAAIIGLRQLKAIKDDSEVRTTHSKASFIFQLDQLLESEAFMASRVNFIILEHEIKNEIIKQYGHLADSNMKNKMSELFAEKMHALYNNRIEDYQKIMKLCGFFETAGALVAGGYIAEHEIINLYGGWIIELYDQMKLHIQKRQGEMAPGYLENFIDLANRAERAQNRKSK